MGGAEIGGPSIFVGWNMGGLQFLLDGIWGALKCQKMTLGGGSSSFF